MREAEAQAGLDPRNISDPYAPYANPEDNASPYGEADGYGDPWSTSTQALPLVANASHLQRNEYDDDDERKSFHSRDFDVHSALTSNRDDAVSQFGGTESYAPSRNMFHNADVTAPLDKEALPGEIQEGETTEVVKESSARRRWVAFVWMLTFWMPSVFLTWFGRMKRLDVRQAWREKLALNIIIWFVCGCAIFIIAVLGLLICPTEHVFSTTELASHSYKLNPNNVYTSIRGEVFDLTEIAVNHLLTVGVVPSKSVLAYGGTSSTNIFPVQACIVNVSLAILPSNTYNCRLVHFAME
jgi:chitin synthase